MRRIEDKQIKAIWAAARETRKDKQAVYDIIFAVAEKEHMTELTYIEAAKVLGKMQDKKEEQKRTDTGGDVRTVPLRQKIYALTGELEWNDNNSRIDGFCKRLCNVEKVEELTVGQCHKVIEALKQMIERKESEEKK